MNIKKIIFALLAFALTVTVFLLPVSASARVDADPSQFFDFPGETNVGTATDTNILDSMVPETMNTNIPDSAVESNSVPESTSAVSNVKDSGERSVLIGIIIAIIAVTAVTILVIVLIPKSKKGE